MAYSKITIEFTQVPEINEIINFYELVRDVYFLETFKVNRLSSNQVRIPPYVIGVPGYLERTSLNFKNAFNADYNSNNQFEVTWNDNVGLSGLGSVTIQAKYANAQFGYTFMPVGAIVTIENEPELEEFFIETVTFSPAITPYDTKQYLIVNVLTSLLAKNILEPIIYNGNMDNPYSFYYMRNQNLNIKVEDANGQISEKFITTPSFLNPSNFNIEVTNSPNGATIIITNTNTFGLNLEYSLDSLTWQVSNIFSGILEGNYELYIKDQFGVFINKNFTVNQFGIYVPFFEISKANSFRFANRISFGDSANYKTDENTLSCEVEVKLPKKEIQLFQSADIITTQFKSNYQTNTAKIIKEDLSEVIYPVVKKTSNIGIKDKRDAIKYDLGNGKTGIYFLSGNIYDYDTDTINNTYALNGSTPEWAQSGNYIVIGNAWFLIEDIVFDESKNADVIVYSNAYTGAELNVIVGSVFNRENFEVYEFYIDMVDYIDQQFRVEIENSDSHFTTITHLSELIWCKIKHDNVLEIKYRNTTNTDVFYSTGIQFLIRIPYLFMRGKVEENSETYKTDTDALLLSADLYEVDEIQFKPVTKELWRKLMIALSCEKVSINGVGYVKNGGFNTDGPLGNTNLYVLTATMIKTGNVYNSQTSGSLGFDGTAVEVPGLIESDSGYVSYL